MGNNFMDDNTNDFYENTDPSKISVLHNYIIDF